MKTFIRDALSVLLMAVVIFFGLRVTVGSVVVEGPSMRPSFRTGQWLVINKIVYSLHEPERGDVVILHQVNDGPDDLIKRVIGLPGESVEIREGVVYINTADGKVFPLDEPYVAERADEPFKGGVIPENEYFVLGDSRIVSDDSRRGWTAPCENIVGKAWVSVWPLYKWGLVAHYTYKGE
ncbi:signal peptidase I [Chloroflexota bacterium]